MTDRSDPLRVFTIDDKLAGVRLDKALARLLGGVPRSRLREMVEDGRVRIGGQVVRRPAHPLEGGDRVELEWVERDRSRAGRPDGRTFEVLYEDEHLIGIDKPPGMVAHPSARVRGGTVSELAVERYGPLPDAQGADRPGIVHRLDAETSGVMVLARTPESAAALMAEFRERRVKKRYLALVHGDPRFDSDWIEKPIARSERASDRMAAVSEGEGREALTFYQVLERFGDLALLSCEPHTGRTHQIRVHLSSIGHTVVGDSLYRARRTLALPPGAPDPGRHALHAARLELSHPASGEPLRLEAPLRADLEELMQWLRAR